MLKLNRFSNFILKDITLKIQNSQNLIILGNNGAGKTTLAKVLSGIIESSNLSIDDKNLHNLWGCERRTLVNYIPTKLEIFDEYMSVEEFLKLSHFDLQLHISDVLDMLDISYLQDKSCKNLSSGESQLLLIASAILHNAQFTIFDEILANLDPKRQKQIYDLISQKNFLQSKIIISHNLDFAFKLGWDILYMSNGKIVFHGTNKDFFLQSHLDTLFDGSVKKLENHIVVDL